MDARHFGDYSVIKQIGQGSLGTVFLAEQRFMKRQYVLKVLPEEMCADRSFIQRLEEDVAILAGLDHSNIVKIHNVSFANGQYFLVTDCIVDDLGETTNLAQYLLARGTRLEEEQIFLILHQIADALQFAHSKKASGKGIPHRGLKLNNILIGKQKGMDIEVFLSDFGLSRIIGHSSVLTRVYQAVAESIGFAVSLLPLKNHPLYPSNSVDQAKLSQLHLSFLQNYAFLAPEQKKPEQMQAVDGKADIYAFGVLAYYLLIGNLPEGIFKMPSTQADFSKNWDPLIQSCLQSDPLKRPENILDVLEEVCHNPVSAKGPIAIDPSSDEIFQQKIIQPIGGKSSSPLKPVIRTAQIERPNLEADPTEAFQIDNTVKFYVPDRKEIKNVQPSLTDMVIVQGGKYYRGSNDGNRDETPRHQITLDSFAIDIHPVTNEQFVRFLEAMGGEKDSNHHDIIRLRDSRIKRSAGKLLIESGYAKHPVVGVTWYGAIAYCKWIGKRLPTEAEWEIAAYGGLENALYQTGDDIEKSQANFFSSDTTPVMSYAPNGYGIYDLAGNVYDWCHDWYSTNYYEVSIQEPENPKGPLQGVYRSLRGGCWKSLKEDLRCSRRHRNNPGTVNSTYGFRCAADVQ